MTAAAGNLRSCRPRAIERGADTYLNELVAQRTLYSAQQSLIATQLILATNLVTLYTSSGRRGPLGSGAHRSILEASTIDEVVRSTPGNGAQGVDGGVHLRHR